MNPTIGMAMGVMGSLFGASQAADAQKEAADEQMQMAAPYLQEAKLALPQLRALAQGYYAPRVGKDNPLIAAQHQLSLGNIARAKRVGMANITHQFATTGNVGRSRGEQLRLANQLLQSQNQENLGYGQAQQAYRDSTAAQYENILNALIGVGNQGLSLGSSALQRQGNATAGFWDTFGKTLGSLGTFGQALGSPGTGNSNGKDYQGDVPESDYC